MSLTRVQRTRNRERIAGITWRHAGVLESKRTVHLEFGAVKRSHSAPAREQRRLREQRRRASPAQSEEGESRAPARARTAAAQHWVLRNMLWRSRVATHLHGQTAALRCRRRS